MGTKKTMVVLAGAILVLASAVYADDAITVSSSNEIGSDIVTVTDDDNTFAGMYDEFIMDMTSERVDAGLDIKLQMTTDSDGVPEAVSWNDDDFDWYAAFRPVNFITLGFSTDFFLSGSYLAVEDDNIAGGKMGSDGLTVAYTGISGLTLAVTAPFGFDSEEDGPNKFDDDDKDDEDERYFDAGFGGEYNFGGKAALGAVIHDIANSDTRGWGIYGSLTPVENLALYAGFAYRDTEGLCDIVDKHLINASIAFTPGNWDFAADYITSTDEDFYTGLNIGYDVSDSVNVAVGGTLNGEYSDRANGTYVLKPAVTYTHSSLGEFKAEVDIAFVEEDFDNMTLPVYWKYSF